MNAITPVSLISSIEAAVSLSRSVSKRPNLKDGGFCDQSTVEENCGMCETILLPLLKAMPQGKSMAQYPDLKPPRAAPTAP